MSKKKIGIIIAVVVIIAAAAGGGAWYLLKDNDGSSADKVFVESVADLISSASGAQNRYSGVVEAQESWKVNKEADREIKEVFVEEGDMVEEGDPLFEYDMDDVEAELAQAELDLEGMQNEITDYRNQIEQLTKEKNAAPSDEKYQYTADIQEKENSIKQTEYNIESKKAEMEKKQETIDNAVVLSKLAGVVKSINDSNSNNDMMSGEDTSYMTVLAVGDFRVKGTVSETNVQMLSEEQPVILRSRIDEEQTWPGTISKIDTQNEVTNENNGGVYFESEGGAEKATKYPFYIDLESTEGLMMGQHLFIELDQGQTEAKEGIWLFEGYIVQEDELSYVWAADERNKLQKRIVELGEHDENTGQYEILSGLSEEDAIAFPMEGLYEGVTTVTNADEVDYTSPLYNQEGEEGTEDGQTPEGEADPGEEGDFSGEGDLSEFEDFSLDEDLGEEGDSGEEDLGEEDSGGEEGTLSDTADTEGESDSDSGELPEGNKAKLAQ
ncbi:efflux RND transporter periplasmic adaptor subunit [Lachnospiraceae bacterium]|nr:efflux RND transporter periplasmic adaptor subunit [Lachnospiraceae bacterium]